MIRFASCLCSFAVCAILIPQAEAQENAVERSVNLQEVLQPELQYVVAAGRRFDPRVDPEGATWAADLRIQNTPPFIDSLLRAAFHTTAPPTRPGPPRPSRVPAFEREIQPAGIGLLATGSAALLSEEQASFLESAGHRAGHWAATYVLLFAVREEDARRMGPAFLEWLEAEVSAHLASHQQELEELPQRIAAARQELEEMTSARQALEEQRRTARESLNVEDDDTARNLRFEYQKLLNLIEVELSGIRAKVDAIKNLLPHHQAPTIRASLQQMLTAQDVELAGVLARKNAAEEGRKELDNLLGMSRRINTLRLGRQHKETEIRQLDGRAAELERFLADTPEQVAQMHIVDNLVTLRPLEQPAP